MTESFCILTFGQTSAAIRAEALLKERELPVRVIPLPGEISAGCGISLRTENEGKDAACEILRDNGFSFGLYSCEKDGLKKNIEKIEA